MTNPSRERRDSEAMLAAAGMAVTEEGKARARRKLADADARWTPERFAEAQQQLGIPAKAA